MSDSGIVAALKKRREIEQRIVKTQARIKAFKTQLSEVNAFISQWEKFSGKSAPELPDESLAQNETSTEVDTAAGNSSKEEVAKAARVVLHSADGPMSRAELYKRLVFHGLRIRGKNPEMVLSTMLWRAGKDAGIVRLKSGGYALAERTNPQDHEDIELFN